MQLQFLLFYKYLCVYVYIYVQVCNYIKKKNNQQTHLLNVVRYRCMIEKVVWRKSFCWLKVTLSWADFRKPVQSSKTK